MGKGRKKDKRHNKRQVDNQDAFQRMNFLYHAAMLMATTPSPDFPTTVERVNLSEQTSELTASLMNGQIVADNKQLAFSTPTAGLARFYSKNMKTVGRKLVLRMDPAVKRTLCKYCDMVWVPGVTSSVSMLSKVHPNHRRLVQTCRECGWKRSLLIAQAGKCMKKPETSKLVEIEPVP